MSEKHAQINAQIKKIKEFVDEETVTKDVLNTKVEEMKEMADEVKE